MKLLFRTLFVLLIFVGFTSCDDEVVGESLGGVNSNAQFRVDINGETFYADLSGMLTKDGVTEIVGKRNDGAKVRMVVQGAGADSYILSGSTAGSAYYYDGYTPNPYSMSAVDTIGVLTITKYDVARGLASGTFYFNVERDFTDGIFQPGGDSSRNFTTNDEGDDDNGDGDNGDGDNGDGDNGNDNGNDDNWNQEPGLPNELEMTNGVFTDIPLHIVGDNPDNPNPGEDTASFHVKLDGQLFDATSNEIVSHFDLAEGLNMDVQANGAQFFVNIYNPQEGNIDLSSSAGNITYRPEGPGSSPVYEASEGVINITYVDMGSQEISGTFSGTLRNINNNDDVITMTSGSFTNIHFTSDIADNFYIKAKVGTGDFNTTSITTTDNGNGVRKITGTTSSNKQINLYFPSSINIGTYQVSNSGSFTVEYVENGTVYTSIINSGSIKVNERQGTVITGTFSLSVRNPAGEVLQIINGQYKTDLAL